MGVNNRIKQTNELKAITQRSWYIYNVNRGEAHMEMENPDVNLNP